MPQNTFNIPEMPTWQNVLKGDSYFIEHITELTSLADLLNYPYILWNDRVYAVQQDAKTGLPWERETHFTVVDIT